jgi:ribosomal protein S13
LKFEQVLQIYWSKGFLYNGRIVPFHVDIRTFCKSVGGLGLPTKIQILKRFELNFLYYNYSLAFTEISKDIRKVINIILSQISSVNGQVGELNKYNLIRLYLIKTYRGKAQALGKPSRGQRTWSNAWTSYNYNKVIKNFISNIQKNLNKNKKDEKINFKVLKKKTKKTKKKTGLTKIKKKVNTWF